MEQATCRACVDACPTGAWVIDDERLGIDIERCDGCGLCAPACPEGAIEERYAPLHCRIDGVGIAFAVCDRAPGVGAGEAGAGLLPCLHVLGVRALLDLWRRGVRRVSLCAGDCDDCQRGANTRIEQHLGQVNALLLDRAQPPIEAQYLEGGHWLRSLRAARALHRSPSVDRRAFFRGLLSAASETALALAERVDPGTPDFVPPGRLVPGTEAERLRLHAPHVDEALCTGCDACARLCPHGVIQVEPDAYRFEPDGCTGCGICRDVCEAGALSVVELVATPQAMLPLTQGSCRACGVQFHRPQAAAAASRLCPICSVSNPNQRLFQVLA